MAEFKQNYFQRRTRDKGPKYNNRINSPEVQVIASNGENLGVINTNRAIAMAKEEGLDLIEIAPNAKPEDIKQPGHLLPLMADPGGVLIRAGHTEAGCDLTRLAGLTSAAVIAEILNEDGTMARRPELINFARKHQIKIGTIADLIQYRIANE